MLTHLQYVSFPLLLINLNRFHVSLPNYLDGDSLSSQHMSATPYLTELPLAEWMLKPVEVLDVLLVRPIFNEQGPLDLLVLTPKVKS